MRYMVARYVKRAGQRGYDEIVTIEKKVTKSTLMTAMVILDLGTSSIVKMRKDFDKETDFNRVYDYYQQHYPSVLVKRDLVSGE